MFRDLALPSAVIAFIAIMIFPLPIWTLDLLLTCNISLSLVLLISSVYLSQPERWTSLPTILLLTTLFRLSLNISTSRQLLASGLAPDIVVTFGNFVVQGNIVVGMVIFIMITIVQFLVIAKGAERVAEVAARFTLDAMPGKQMAIDADLRSGVLSLQEGKERRAELQREAKLYGALDGAMKFVKGDAIAALLITFINITAGLLLGITQEGLGVVEAARKYTLFTVGDGLVSQIPALLVTVAAGIAVTRVVDKDEQIVGREIISQLGSNPQVLAAAGCVLFLLASVPGLPIIPFVFIGMLLFLAARRVSIVLARRSESTKNTVFTPRTSSILKLRLSPKVFLLLQKERVLSQLLVDSRSKTYSNWGVIVPELEFDVVKDWSDVKGCILLHGVELWSNVWTSTNGHLPSGVSLSHEIIRALDCVVQKNIVGLINDTQTRMLLDIAQGQCEDLINSVVPDMISVTSLTCVLRKLLQERIGISNISLILQSIAEFKIGVGESKSFLIESKEQDILESDKKLSGENLNLLAYIRASLSRQISQRVCSDNWKLKAWMLDSELDAMFVNTLLSKSCLSPVLEERIIEYIRRIQREEAVPLVILASRNARPMLSQILFDEISDYYVLSHEELSKEVKIEILGTVSLSQNRSEEDIQEDDDIWSEFGNGALCVNA